MAIRGIARKPILIGLSASKSNGQPSMVLRVQAGRLAIERSISLRI
jgi:hypothetical protein